MEFLSQRMADQGVLGLMLVLVCLAMVYIFRLTERMINRLFDVLEKNTKAITETGAAVEKLEAAIHGRPDWAKHG